MNPPVLVTETPVPSRSFEGPTTAVDPRDSNRVYVAAADLQRATCHVYRSTDGGASFAELDPPSFGNRTDCGLNRGGLPQNMRMKLVVDPEGVVYWVLAVADPAALGARSVVLARSSDGGQSWRTTTVAEAPVPRSPDEAVANFVPDVFVDPFGAAPRRVWVSWRRSFSEASERTTEGWAALSDDGGQTFAREVRGIEANPGFDAPRVVMDDQGTVYWFQRERPPSPEEGEDAQPSTLLMARSSDGGRTWEQGGMGQAEQVMEEPLAAVSPDGGSLYLAWADGRNGDLDVFFMRSGDQGRTWSEPLRVNDDPQGNRRSQKWPRMSIAPGGRIDLAWYDYRNDDMDVPEDDVEFFLGDVNDVYLASSNDGGSTFSENIRVTDGPIDRSVGTYNTQYFVEVPPGVSSSDAAAVVTWSDTRLASQVTSAQDIFGARVELADGETVWLQRAIALSVTLALVGIGLLVLARRRRSFSKSSTA
ncbi:MAG: exo-alpha-sialidase [Actinomycetota bacterium]|nr:exo-alpha-sialidase [Actinomycetota bacterium]